MPLLRYRLHILANFLVSIVLGLILLTGSNLLPGNQTERLRVFTRPIEFNYEVWMVNAFQIKFGQIALGTDNYLSPEMRHKIVKDYLVLVTEIKRSETELNDIYADPNIQDPQQASRELRQRLEGLYTQKGAVGSLAESILQDQISLVVARLGLSLGGQPVPAVLFHTTPMPWALIVSPRNVIRQEEDISLIPDLTVDQQAMLEEKVDQALNVSSLVVGIGGVGVYPTMVEQTNNLEWMSEVVSHEWVHNFLTLRPLGASYLNSPALRTMNETTASLAGREIGRIVLEEFYPELVPAPVLSPGKTAVPGAAAPQTQEAQKPTEPAPFSFNKEMRITRVNVDQMLADGKIDEAEAYIEQRRVFFWNNGYHLRKLNQAYFAFHGAYADSPEGGAAGSDPVGAAVRSFRTRSASLADFLNRISWMWTFEQLQKAVEG